MADLISVVTRVQPAPVVVKYNGNGIEPAPLIDFTVEPVLDDSGTRTANRTRLTLTSSILIFPSGSYEQMYVKQEQLRSIFSVDFGDFVILAGPGNKTLAEGTIIASGLRPRVNSVNITPDVHVTRFDYSVELEDNTGASGVSGVTDSFSNQWSFREDPDACVLQVTHNVSAQGITGQPDAFQQAVRRVKAALGINQLPIDLPCFTEPNASGSFSFIHPSNPAGGPIFEVSTQREEVADVANGSYSVTEVFTIVSGVPFFYNQKTASYTEDQNGIATVTVQGTVQGLGRTNTPGLGLEGGVGFQRAASGFLNQVKPQLPYEASGIYQRYKINIFGSGLAVNNPQSISITENKCRGTVQFAYTYTDDPAVFLPSGIASRECSVTINDGIRVIASHPIPFRRIGPLLQSIQTTTEGSISITCNAQAKNTSDNIADTNRAIQFVQDELNRLRRIHANVANFQTLRVGSQNQTFSDIDLTCNANVTYIFTTDIASTLSNNSDIVLVTI